MVVPPNTNASALKKVSRRGAGGGYTTNLHMKVPVYPVGVMSKGGVWGNFLKVVVGCMWRNRRRCQGI